MSKDFFEAGAEKLAVGNTGANSKPKGWNGGLLIALGVLVALGSLMFPAGIEGGYLQGDVFNLGRGLTKLMIFLAGGFLVLVGAIFEAANHIADTISYHQR